LYFFSDGLYYIVAPVKIKGAGKTPMLQYFTVIIKKIELKLTGDSMKAVFIITTAGLLFWATTGMAQEVLYVKKVPSAPSIDGNVDNLWNSVTPTVINVEKIPAAIIETNLEKQQGKYAKNWKKTSFTEIKEVELKAVRTDDKIFFLARWLDDTRDDQHKPWKWQGDRESGEYVTGKEREDRLSFKFPIKGTFDANMLSDKEGVADVWQWKAARTNPAGIIHDKSHIYSKTPLKGKYSSHFTASGSGIFLSRPGDGGISPYRTNKIDPFVYTEQMVPKYIPFVPDNDDAKDVSAKGVWASGKWTVEAGRNLDTGHRETDTVFDPAKDTLMAIAVFNHAGDHFHAVSQEIKVVFD
jgi:hypothetical protein